MRLKTDHSHECVCKNEICHTGLLLLLWLFFVDFFLFDIFIFGFFSAFLCCAVVVRQSRIWHAHADGRTDRDACVYLWFIIEHKLQRVNRIVLLFVKVIGNEILSFIFTTLSLALIPLNVIQNTEKNHSKRFSTSGGSTHNAVRSIFPYYLQSAGTWVCVQQFWCCLSPASNINHNWFVNRARLKNKYLIRSLSLTWDGSALSTNKRKKNIKIKIAVFVAAQVKVTQKWTRIKWTD